MASFLMTFLMIIIDWDRVIPAKIKAANDEVPNVDAARATKTVTTHLIDHHHECAR